MYLYTKSAITFCYCYTCSRLISAFIAIVIIIIITITIITIGLLLPLQRLIIRLLLLTPCLQVVNYNRGGDGVMYFKNGFDLGIAFTMGD